MAVLWLRDLGARSEKASDGLDEVFTVLEVLPAVAAIKCWRDRLLRLVFVGNDGARHCCFVFPASRDK